MANYNSKRIYNKKLPDGGANYNSGPFAIVILDNCSGLDYIKNILSSSYISDIGGSDELVSATATLEFKDLSISSDESVFMTVNVDVLDRFDSVDEVTIPPINVYIPDFGSGIDNISLLPILISIGDKFSFDDKISLNANVFINELAKGVEIAKVTANVALSDFGVSTDLGASIVGAFFVIDSNNILHPLGVLVTRDSRYELLPATRDSTEEITGRHGEIDFGTELKPMLLELHVATDEGLEPLEKARLQRLFAKYLDPTKGAKTLIFSDDVEKAYTVKYSGKIDLRPNATWFDFVLPFKMSDPFITGSFQKTLVGSGTLENEGTFETGLIIEITGSDTNPSLTIGGEILKYTGTIPSGQKLIIDTDKETAKIGTTNAIADYNGVFPLLYPGKTNVVANGNVTIRWRDKWI